jgi:aspartyl-tRNA(Asn)/glutamyl-tRNA(Gln) amidotransferase subunit C
MPTSHISTDQVKRVAELARVGLTDTEIIQATKDLSNILSHFATIQDIDTQNVPTSDDITGLKNITRIDEATPETLCSHADLLAAAPDIQSNQIKVKAIFN